MYCLGIDQNSSLVTDEGVNKENDKGNNNRGKI